MLKTSNTSFAFFWIIVAATTSGFYCPSNALVKHEEKVELELDHEETSLDAQVRELLLLTRCFVYDQYDICASVNGNLENYNILCKLLHKDPAKTVADIDKVWHEELAYKYWKEEKIQEFNHKKLEPIEQQELIRHILFCHLDPRNKNAKQYYLFFRWLNLLKELIGEIPNFAHYSGLDYPPLDTKDYEWLTCKAASIIQIIHQSPFYRERAYRQWQEEVLGEFREEWSLHAKVLFCIKEVSHALELSKYDETGSYAVHACDMYNILRELCGLERIEDYSSIDHGWLAQITKEAESLQDKADAEDHVARFEYRHKGTEADSIQQALLQYAKKTANVEEDILLLSSNDKNTGAASKSVLAINNYPNLDYQLFIIYHELGHIFYKDAEITQSIENSEISVLEILESSEYKTIEATSKKYLEKAKLALDSSSALGKKLKDISDTTTTFWIPAAVEGNAYATQLFGRVKEKRADLFALEKLYEQNKINAIILWIHNLAFGENREGQVYVTVTGLAPHPSDIERALYGVGFLAEKGVDIARLFKQWEEQGLSEPIENILQETALLEKVAAESKGDELKNSLHTIYINELNYNYKRWKEKTYGNLNNASIVDDPKLSLSILKSALGAWNTYQARPSDYSRAHVLNLYNFLRELASKKQVICSYDIDKRWMRDLYAQLWSNSVMQEYKEACFDYKEQIKDLTLRSLNDFSCFYHDLISVYKIPYEDGTIGQPFYSESLFNAWSAYNLLRTMTGKDIAQYPNYIIDYAWLKDLSFQLWKEEIIKVFNQQNSTFADYEQLCTRIYLFGIEEAFKHFAIQTPIPPYISKIGKVLNFNPADNYSPMRQVLYKPGETFNTLYSYNLVRELANKPKVEKAADIDHQWVLEELIKNQTTFCGSQKKSDTPARGGGLMGCAASKAAILISLYF